MLDMASHVEADLDFLIMRAIGLILKWPVIGMVILMALRMTSLSESGSGAIAQWLEHSRAKREALGSIPIRCKSLHILHSFHACT